MIADEMKERWIYQYASSIEYKTHEDWGNLWGIHKNTVNKMLKDYAPEIAEIRAEIKKQAIAGISNLIPKAIEKVNGIMNSSIDDKVVLECAEKVLKYAVGSKQSIDAVVEHKTSGIRELLADEETVKEDGSTTISKQPEGSSISDQ